MLARCPFVTTCCTAFNFAYATTYVIPPPPSVTTHVDRRILQHSLTSRQHFLSSLVYLCIVDRNPDNMAPRLRVVVSTPSKVYPPSEPMTVNTSKPTPLKTPHFEGEVSVWIKNYEGDHKGGEGGEYFDNERGDKTYAIVVKGRFKDEVDGDQVMWGNVFEKPIRDSLPWGTSIATKFM